jgi:opine dehydrogenase
MKICVIGAGNGGQALAGYLALRGQEVSLYNRSKKRIAPFMKSKNIRIEGAVNDVGHLEIVTTNIEEAIRGRELIMVVVPAFAHRDIATKIAPYLEDGQVILLNPGRTFGALEFSMIFSHAKIKKNVTVAEAQTFVFASRASNPGVVHIFRIKNAVPVAALPSSNNPVVASLLEKVMPEFSVERDVLYTSINNIGAVFHPAALILNSGWVESTSGKFEFYLDGITPSVAKVLEAIDRERCQLAEALDVEPLTAKAWLDYAYDVYGPTLHDAIHSNSGYQGIMAPPSLQNRYLYEDVPMSLVPLASMAKEFGIKTPTIDAIVHIASVLLGTDFVKEGRTVEKFHLNGKTKEELLQIVEKGTDII